MNEQRQIIMLFTFFSSCKLFLHHKESFLDCLTTNLKLDFKLKQLAITKTKFKWVREN